MTKQHSDFTDDELNILVALAQGWTLTSRDGKKSSLFDVSFPVIQCWQTKLLTIDKDDYQPTLNGGHALELVKEFNIYLEPYWKTASDIPWIALTEEGDQPWEEAPTPERAICLAVVASVYSVEECVELLKEVA